MQFPTFLPSISRHRTSNSYIQLIYQRASTKRLNIISNFRLNVNFDTAYRAWHMASLRDSSNDFFSQGSILSFKLPIQHPCWKFLGKLPLFLHLQCTQITKNERICGVYSSVLRYLSSWDYGTSRSIHYIQALGMCPRIWWNSFSTFANVISKNNRKLIFFIYKIDWLYLFYNIHYC